MSEPMIKRTDPVPDFDYFVEDQVLTARQLNRVIGYFDRQHRKSRIHLSGIGILCGLQVRLVEGAVRLEQGAAVTSDGDLLEIPEDRILTRVRPFLDEDAAYPPFRSGNGEVIGLWELFEQDSAEPDLQPLASLLGQDADAGSLVALLYLESWLRPYDICTGSDCDNRGPTQVGTLRVLLARREDLQPDPPTPEQEYFDLEHVHIPRVLLNETPVDSFFASGERGLAHRYLAAVGGLRERLSATFAKMATGSFRHAIENLAVQGAGWSERIENTQAFPETAAPGIQYVYAAMCDLAQACNEWRESLFGLGATCIPDASLYPKHVLLGGLLPDVETDAYRHRLRPSAGRVEQERLEHCLFLLKRIGAMLRFFEMPRGSETEDTDTASIRLTPSGSPRQALGERAIPYYYRPSDARPLHQLWSWDLSRRRRERSIASYDMTAYNPGAGSGDFAANPLGFDTHQFDFIRIEGHINKRVEEVRRRLESLAREHNLAFKVETIQIEDRPDRVIPPPFRFFDIESLFHLYRSDFTFTLKRARDFAAHLESDQLTSEELDDNDQAVKARESAGRLKQRLDDTLESVPRGFMDFEPEKTEGFKIQLEHSFPLAETMSADVRDITRASTLTPVQRFADGNRFVQFGVLQDILAKRRFKLRQLSIFARFVKDHPGLEHLGGVWRGGTFVLAYEADSRRVLADFCLPYYACCELKDTEPEEVNTDPPDEIEVPPYVFRPPVWGDFNRIPVFTLQGREVLDRFNRVNADIDQKIAPLNLRLDGIDSAIDLRMDAVTQVFDNRFNDVGRQVDVKVDAFTQAFEQIIRSEVGQVDAKVAGVENLLNTRVEGIEKVVDSRVASFEGTLETFILSSSAGRPPAVGGTVVGVAPGAAPIGVISDANQTLVAKEVESKLIEKQAIEERRDKGMQLPGDATRIHDLEKDLAELVVSGVQLDSVRRKPSEELSSGDRAFVDLMRTATLELTESEAKARVGAELEVINNEQPNTLLTRKLGGLSGVVR